MRLHVPSKCIDILVPLLLKKRLRESGQFSTPIATDSSSFSFFLFDIRSHNTGNSDDLPYLDSIFYFQAFRDFFFHKLESHFSLLNFVDRNNIVKKISSKSICSRRRCSNRTYTDLPVPRFVGRWPWDPDDAGCVAKK